MNEIVNKFLLVGDRFMPEMHLKVLLIVLVAHLPKAKKELKVYANWKYRFFIEMNLVRLVFNIIWLMTK